MSGWTQRFLGGLAAFVLTAGIGVAGEPRTDAPDTCRNEDDQRFLTRFDVAPPAVAFPLTTTPPEVEKAAGWTLLFDSETTVGWQAYGVEGAADRLRASGGALSYAGEGSIATIDEYEEFELSFEFKLEKETDADGQVPFVANADPSGETPLGIRASRCRDPFDFGSLEARYRPPVHPIPLAGSWITFVASDPADLEAAAPRPPNGLTDGEKAAGWKPFFDGEELARVEILDGGDSARERTRIDGAVEEGGCVRLQLSDADALEETELQVRAWGGRDPFLGGALDRPDRRGAAPLVSFGGWRHVHMRFTHARIEVHLDGVKVRELDRIFPSFDRYPATTVVSEHSVIGGWAWGVVGFRSPGCEIALRDVKIKREADAKEGPQIFNFYGSGQR